MGKQRVTEVTAKLVWAEVNGKQYNPLREISFLSRQPKGAVKWHNVLLCNHILTADTVTELDELTMQYQDSPEWQAKIADAQWELQQMGIRLEEWVDAQERRQWYLSVTVERYS